MGLSFKGVNKRQDHNFLKGGKRKKRGENGSHSKGKLHKFQIL